MALPTISRAQVQEYLPTIFVALLFVIAAIWISGDDSSTQVAPGDNFVVPERNVDIDFSTLLEIAELDGPIDTITMPSSDVIGRPNPFVSGSADSQGVLLDEEEEENTSEE